MILRNALPLHLDDVLSNSLLFVVFIDKGNIIVFFIYLLFLKYS